MKQLKTSNLRAVSDDLKLLSRAYSIATERSHQQITELYEKMHTSNGDPITTEERIRAAVVECKRALVYELDLATSAVREYCESRKH